MLIPPPPITETQGLRISPMLVTTDLLKTSQALDKNLATSMSSGKQTCTNYKKSEIDQYYFCLTIFEKGYVS